jgi:hypothetical protein
VWSEQVVRGSLTRVLGFAALLALSAAVAWHLVTFVELVAGRLGYPMDIEWMEGGALYHAHRLLHGLPVYSDPSSGWAPFPYPPGHLALLAAAGWVFGLDYATGRGLSLLCLAAILALSSAEAWRAGGPIIVRLAVAGFVAGVILAATPLLRSWYDLIRNDGLFIAWSVLAAVLVSGRRRPGWAALALSAAFFTKQTAIFFMAAIGLFVIARDRRQGLWLGGLTAGVCGATLALLQVRTGGWYWRWITVMNGHHLSGADAISGLGQVMRFAPFLPVLVPAALLLAARGALRPRTRLWLLMLAAALPASLLPFAKQGGFANDFMPLVVVGAVAAGQVALDALAVWRRPAALIAAASAAAAFLAGRSYDPRPFVPGAALWRRAQEMERLVARLPGDVVIPDHPFLAVRAGKRNQQFHAMAYFDAVNSPVRPLLTLSRLLDVPWVIADGPELDLPFLREAVSHGFVVQRLLPDAPENLVGGGRTAPQLLLARSAPVCKVNRRMLFDFEGDDYAGWTVTGTAFSGGPTGPKPPRQGAIAGQGGRRLANSFHPVTLDAARGTVISPAFVIDRRFLALKVGGGTGPAVRVELRVDGVAVRSTSGLRSEVMSEVVWDVGEWKQRSATVALIDESPAGWGHILADDFELFD